MEEQVVSIFSGVNGYLDGLDTDAVNRYETALLENFRANQGDLLKAIREEGEISDENEQKLKDAIEAFTSSFV